MRYWDASAVVPLITEPPGVGDIRHLLDEDHEFVIWWGTPVECLSAFVRREREGRLTAADVRAAEQRLNALLGEAREIQPSGSLREGAGRLLHRYPLSASDALQLAAALVTVRERPRDVGFVCLDQRLREAAAREGFTVLPESP